MVIKRRKKRSRRATKFTDQKLLLTRDDLKRIGILRSNSTLIRAEAAGRFPRRIRMSSVSVAWDRDEVIAWIEERKAERANWHYADAS